MMRLVRRLFWLGLLAGAGLAVSRIVARRQSPPSGAPSSTPAVATRPTAPPAGQPPVATAPAARTPAATTSERWVASVDGECPAGYPVKANDKSRIFHVPGGRFYDRTVAERCYATQDDAVADGYRPAKA